VQIWVTSNLWWDESVVVSSGGSPNKLISGKVLMGKGVGLNVGSGGGAEMHRKETTGWKRRLGGKWGGRRWDWGEVGWRCGVPMAVCYFVTAWAEMLRREWEGC
jgi:hypothetical protein